MCSTGWLGTRRSGCPWDVLAIVAHVVAVQAQPQEDTAPPQIACPTSPIRLASTTMELTAELALSDVFQQFTDNDNAPDAEMTITVTSDATGGELDSLVIAPNAGAASAEQNLDSCDASGGIRGIQLMDGVEGEQIGRGDSAVLSPTADYQNSIECYWRLSCSNPAASPSLRFTSFNTEAGYDYVRIRDGSGPADQLLSTQHGWGDYTHEYTWPVHRGSFLSGATIDNLVNHGSEDAARQACIALGDGCGGIVQVCGAHCDDRTAGEWHTRAGSVPLPNPNANPGIAHEMAFVKTISDAIQAGAPAIEATGQDMFVSFETDGSVTKTGFTAVFQCVGATPLMASRLARPRYNDNDNSLTFESYERYDGVDCTSKTLASTSALDDAVRLCSSDSACFGVQDRACDGTGFAVCLADTAYIPVGDAQRVRSCVYERPVYQRSAVGPLELAALQEHSLRIQVVDRAGNEATCDTIVRVVAPQLVLLFEDGAEVSQQDGIAAEAPITTNDRADIVLANHGTDDLVLRTGTPHAGDAYGMALTDGVSGGIDWAVVRLVGENGDTDVQVAGTSDVQIVLPAGTQRSLYIEFFGPQVPEAGVYIGQLQIDSNDPTTPRWTVPLEFTVNDYDLIMIGLPESLDAHAAPATTTEVSQTIYNVYCGDLAWNNTAGCTCGGSDLTYPCRLQHSGDADEVLVELDSCSGTIATGDSYPVLMRLTVPETAGSYSKTWRLEPTNTGSSESFLRASINLMVVPSMEDFQPSRTSVSMLTGVEDSGPVRAAHDFRLLCVMKDSFGNEIRSDGLEGWSLLLSYPCPVGEVAPCILSVPIAFDLSLADGGRAGLYTSAAIATERQGQHGVAMIANAQGEHTLSEPFNLTVEALQCDPPRVLPSTDGASCLVQWCDAGSRPSDDQLVCMPCERGRHSIIGRLCDACGNGTFADKTGSVTCRSCNPGRVSNNDNTGCEKCDRGAAPNIWRNNCTECTSGRFSSSGESCAECQAPFRVTFDDAAGARIGCEKCDPGEEPNADRTACEECTGTTYSSFGVECTTCEAPNIINSERTSCLSCPPGTGPNENRTDCDACTGTLYSQFGICTECQAPFRITFDSATGTRIGCEKCAPGEQPNANRTACLPCTGTTYSSFGNECVECVAPHIVNSARSTCSPCSAGTGPNADATRCVDCTPGWYSTFGVCTECESPRVVTSDRASCLEPSVCAAGTECNESGGCPDQSSCTECPTGTVSVSGGFCQACSDAGKVTNRDNTFCEACLPGSGPRDDRSACEQCTGATYSSFGVECTTCEAPNVVDAAHTTCLPCPAGTGPNVGRTTCLPCEGAMFSTMGQCQNCTAPNVVDMNKITCSPCPSGQGPNNERDGCVDCEINQYSNLFETDGRCQRCPAGQYPKTVAGYRSSCDFCPAGETTSQDGAGCESCPAGTVRPTGGVVCVSCESGRRANSAQSACVPCEAGSIPSEDRMSCVCEVGFYDTNILPKVDCYDTDFHFTRAPTINNAGCAACPPCMICDSGTPRIKDGYGIASWPITITGDDLKEVGVEPDDLDRIGTNYLLLPQWAEEVSSEELATTPARLHNRTFVFKCPVPNSCRGNALVGDSRYNDSCADGHEGRLCFSCKPGWRKGPKGTCSVCEKEGTDHLFLVPVGMVVAYFAFRMFLSRRRQKRLDRVAMSEQLFDDLDLDGSGEINRHELLQGLRMLGHTQADESTAMRIMDLIDLDRSGGIDKHEFVAWMEHNVSQIKMGMVVLKILFGLTQILSRQPETMKEDFPGAHWEEFKLFSFDFSWTMPVCGVNYWIRWGSNALLLPALLLGLVWIYWRTEDCCSKRADAKKPEEAKTTVEDAVVRARMSTMMRGSVVPQERDKDSADGVTLTKEEISVMFEKLDNKLRPEQLNGIWNQMDRDQDGKVSLEELEQFLRIGDNDCGWDERKANMQSDYYFAFFLCYPTMTQTFFSHFNCRSLSDERTVLEADYSIECATVSTEDGMWWLFVALLSAAGIAFVSIGVPLLMWWKMKSFFKEKQDQTRELRISQVVAYRDFHRRFGYISGDFKPEAYYAECVDLFRKLAMTGVLVLLAPGTIIQSFCSVLLSMFFLAVQIKLWPYPHLGANMLKAFTDLQIFLVTLVGLILRIRPDELQKDPLSKGFILCVLEGRPCGDAGSDVDGVTQTAAASFYGDLLLLLLIFTLIPVVLSVLKHSDVQNAQRFLLEAGLTVTQDPGRLDCLCCGRQAKKQEALFRRRDKLRKLATVCTMKLDNLSTTELSDVEQKDLQLAVLKAVRQIRSMEKREVENVRLLPAAEGLVVKVYFTNCKAKGLLESAIDRADFGVHFDNSVYSAYSPDRVESAMEHILQDSLRQSVATVKQHDEDDELDIRVMFNEIDTDNSGFLDRHEAKALMFKLFPGMSDVDFEAAFINMDSDGSEEIDFYEFSDWWKKERVAGRVNDHGRDTNYAARQAALEESKRWIEEETLDLMDDDDAAADSNNDTQRHDCSQPATNFVRFTQPGPLGFTYKTNSEGGLEITHIAEGGQAWRKNDNFMIGHVIRQVQGTEVQNSMHGIELLRKHKKTRPLTLSVEMGAELGGHRTQNDLPPLMPDPRDSVMHPEEDEPPEAKPTPRKELMDIYKKHNPRKLADVDRLISEWSTKPECIKRGGVTTLLKKVRAKYLIEKPEPEAGGGDEPPPSMPDVRESVAVGP